MKTFKWKNEDINQWLFLEDAVLAHNLIASNVKCLEIGTWKGGWILSLLVNDLTRQAVCVDPYPNLEYVRDMFIETANVRASGRFVLYSDLEQVEEYENDIEFAAVHIDGIHSQEAVTRDLHFAVKKLSPTGVVVVDDIFYHDFPGVTAATFQLLEVLDLAPFLFSRKKLYLCRKSQHSYYYKEAKNIVMEMKLKFSEDQTITGTSGPYVQRSSINGHSLIILDEIGVNLAHTRKILKIKINPSPKVIARLILPPILLSLYRKIRNT